MPDAHTLPDLDQTQSKIALSPRDLHIRYLTALDLVSILILTGQALFQHILRDDNGYSRTIDLAGRQLIRAVTLARGSDAARREFCRRNLVDTLDAWRRTDAAFLAGDDRARLKSGVAAVCRAREEHTPLIREIAASIQELVCPTTASPALEAVHRTFLVWPTASYRPYTTLWWRSTPRSPGDMFAPCAPWA
jgi:hypothetical protein